MKKKLEDLDLAENQVYMIEIKINHKWPRDREVDEETSRYWRDFEINDYVDVLVGAKWQVGVVKNIKKEKVNVHFLNSENNKTEVINARSQ